MISPVAYTVRRCICSLQAVRTYRIGRAHNDQSENSQTVIRPSLNFGTVIQYDGDLPVEENGYNTGVSHLQHLPGLRMDMVLVMHVLGVLAIC